MVRIALIFATLWLAAAPAAAQAVEWWHVPRYQRELALTSEQSATIEAIFRRTLKERRALRDSLDRAEAALEDAFSRADENAAMRLIPEVEAARSARNTARTMMLVRIYWVLTPAQRHSLARLTSERRGPEPQANSESPSTEQNKERAGPR
jgi:Spy/CpxP family protein refolding chaperone